MATDTSEASATLGQRLKALRRWIVQDCGGKVHGSLCLVNGEATDGTKQAPVLLLDQPPHPEDALEGRVGYAQDDNGLWKLYDRSMGCQVRAVREIKQDDTLLHIPCHCMITPDLVAVSDAGAAVYECCAGTQNGTTTPEQFWNVFVDTQQTESANKKKLASSFGTQTLVRMLQERTKVERLFEERLQQTKSSVTLAGGGVVSTRAPFLAFLIQQRFASDSPPVSMMGRTNTDSPGTFAPYARALPPCVSIPLCWKRSELALLSRCVSGLSLLQEVTASMQLLAAEFIALVEAGILERFPEVFPPGLLTWDRWVWAAAVYTSRSFPREYYRVDDASVRSPLNVWNGLGIMVPMLDMFNHETEENQVQWVSNDEAAVAHKKIRKGAEIFAAYGGRSTSHGNTRLIQNYGFAQINNTTDEVRLGWAINEAVGNVPPPSDFSVCPHDTDSVYECADEEARNAWWTPERLKLLERHVFTKPESLSTFTSLKNGKKVTVFAYGGGSGQKLHPLLLIATAVATMAPDDVVRQQSPGPLVLRYRHQTILRRYLQFWFARKLEKLLQNLESSLSEYFQQTKLWVQHKDGGLAYKNPENGEYVGWQSFFEQNVYATAIEVEGHYYATTTDACVLTLYDGQLRVLQSSLDALDSDDTLSTTGLLEQLRALDCQLLTAEEDDTKKARGREASGRG